MPFLVQPKAQNEDIGARFGLSPSLIELIKATGVPKYRIFGSTAANAAFSSVK